MKIIATCSLCGFVLPSWWDREAMDAHLAEAHGLYFDPPPSMASGNGKAHG